MTCLKCSAGDKQLPGSRGGAREGLGLGVGVTAGRWSLSDSLVQHSCDTKVPQLGFHPAVRQEYVLEAGGKDRERAERKGMHGWVELSCVVVALTQHNAKLQ